MIGVISKEDEEDIVREFFELFKVPWEFYKKDRYYPVVLSTKDTLEELKANFILLYNNEKIKFDVENKINVTTTQSKFLLKYNELQLPIYGKTSTFDTAANATTKLRGTTGEAVGIEIIKDDAKIIRIGFDLFQEIRFLLSTGQPSQFSQIPTLDIHISMLREWILESGIPLVEIPPVPAGYQYTCCLTHDIDFAGIRRHKFDHTMFGFLYRALLGSLRDVVNRKSPWDKLYKNWKAVFSLPAVYAGFAEDFWMPFNRYTELEEGFRSTFFIIPFKNDAGIAEANKKHERRATRYDVSDIKGEIKGLLSQGCEIGVHGIDAWRDTEKGRKEFERIHEAAGTSEIGIRMHWLYFNDQSPKLLEEAGFLYDSSVGYNDAVGYRAGTTQVFRPIGLKRLLELPLHIQDTALFYPDRMALSEEKAWPLIGDLLENTKQYGGVLTVNWHDRSLAPERLWGNIYIKFLEKLKKSKVWIDTASRVIRWFDKRRSCSFKEVHFTQDMIKLHIACKDDDDVPDLLVRIHTPKTGEVTDINLQSIKEKHLDIHYANVINAEFALSHH
jgi:hypothetical protein